MYVCIANSIQGEISKLIFNDKEPRGKPTERRLFSFSECELAPLRVPHTFKC